MSNQYPLSGPTVGGPQVQPGNVPTNRVHLSGLDDAKSIERHIDDSVNGHLNTVLMGIEGAAHEVNTHHIDRIHSAIDIGQFVVNHLDDKVQDHLIDSIAPHIGNIDLLESMVVEQPVEHPYVTPSDPIHDIIHRAYSPPGGQVAQQYWVGAYDSSPDKCQVVSGPAGVPPPHLTVYAGPFNSYSDAQSWLSSHTCPPSVQAGCTVQGPDDCKVCYVPFATNWPTLDSLTVVQLISIYSADYTVWHHDDGTFSFYELVPPGLCPCPLDSYRPTPGIQDSGYNGKLGSFAQTYNRPVIHKQDNWDFPVLDSAKHCPAGKHWDDASCSCVDDCAAQTCPAGQHWDQSSCSCVPDEPPPVCPTSCPPVITGGDSCDNPLFIQICSASSTSDTKEPDWGGDFSWAVSGPNKSKIDQMRKELGVESDIWEPSDIEGTLLPIYQKLWE